MFRVVRGSGPRRGGERARPAGGGGAARAARARRRASRRARRRGAAGEAAPEEEGQEAKGEGGEGGAGKRGAGQKGSGRRGRRDRQEEAGRGALRAQRGSGARGTGGEGKRGGGFAAGRRRLLRFSSGDEPCRRDARRVFFPRRRRGRTTRGRRSTDPTDRVVFARREFFVHGRGGCRAAARDGSDARLSDVPHAQPRRRRALGRRSERRLLPVVRRPRPGTAQARVRDPGGGVRRGVAERRAARAAAGGGFRAKRKSSDDVGGRRVGARLLGSDDGASSRIPRGG